MRRRDFVRLVGSAAAAWPIAARAQQASKIYRIGFLANDPAIPTQPAGQAFLDGLRESGFIEGKYIIIDRRFAQGRLDRYDKLVAELVQQEPDVLVTSSNEATLAAKRSVTAIPIVMMNVSDPIGQGIIASLARPGGNITGVEQDDTAEISLKRMQLLKDAVPRAAKVAVLFNPDEPFDRSQWRIAALWSRTTKQVSNTSTDQGGGKQRVVHQTLVNNLAGSSPSKKTPQRTPRAEFCWFPKTPQNGKKRRLAVQTVASLSVSKL